MCSLQEKEGRGGKNKKRGTAPSEATPNSHDSRVRVFNGTGIFTAVRPKQERKDTAASRPRVSAEAGSRHAALSVTSIEARRYTRSASAHRERRIGDLQDSTLLRSCRMSRLRDIHTGDSRRLLYDRAWPPMSSHTRCCKDREWPKSDVFRIKFSALARRRT